MPRTEVVFYQEGEVALIVQWLKELPAKVQVKCLAYLTQLEAFGHELRRPVADYLRDGIYELRPSLGGVHYRILYFFPNRSKGSSKPPGVVVVSHGLVKEGAVPDTEIERAIARKEKFEADPLRHSFRPQARR
jgi:phage-related protein